MEYKVKPYYEGQYYVTDYASGCTHFVGSLMECEAWIRLKENDNI